MKKYFILLSILVVIFISACKTQEISKQQANHQTPETLTPKKDTLNWKTYEDKELGFSIKYPSAWFVNAPWESQDVQFSNYDPNNRDLVFDDYRKYEALGITVSRNTKRLTAKEFSDNLINVRKNAGQKVIEEKGVSIDGKNSHLLKFEEHALGGTLKESYIFVPFEDKIYILRSSPSDENLETMASKIKFSSAIQANKYVSEWKLYANKEHGFSIKYPQNWNFESLMDAGEGAGMNPSGSDNSIFRIDFKHPNYYSGSNLNKGRFIIELVPKKSPFYKSDITEFIKELDNKREYKIDITKEDKLDIPKSEYGIIREESYRGTPLRIVAFVKKGESIYIMSAPQSNLPEVKEIYTNILSTFQFN